VFARCGDPHGGKATTAGRSSTDHDRTTAAVLKPRAHDKGANMKTKFLAATIGVLLASTATAALAGTLDDVKNKGFIQCGVSQGLAGFSQPDANGNWSGLDVDFCRSIASAVFNDPSKVKFTPLSAKERFTALQSGEIDVLSRNTTWTMSRDTKQGKFAGVMYYDGQGFMVRK
jgi:general L-amino acid transport system substrate-binding protein